VKKQLVSRNPPNLGLVEWVSNFTDIRKPWDRPWYQALCPPPFLTDNWSYLCLCSNITSVTRYPTTDDHFVYLGQCDYCERVIWRYAKNKLA
jgi:hypothetical protein